MLVVDSSCISKFILKEPGWENLSDILVNSQSVDLAIKEVTNSILKAYRRREIDLNDVHTKFKALKTLINRNIVLANQEGLIDDALQMAISSKNLTIYDALFIVLARKKGMPLTTCDRVQYEEAMKNGITASIIE